jgi:hypothetical protein
MLIAKGTMLDMNKGNMMVGMEKVMDMDMTIQVHITDIMKQGIKRDMRKGMMMDILLVTQIMKTKRVKRTEKGIGIRLMERV